MEKARDLSKFFLAQGAEIQVVGGFVRDMILGKKTSDIDLVANCQPEVTVQILQKNHIKYRKTHISHGVIVAIMDGNYFEISSLRQDVECYGRKAKVSFVKDFALDAQRRDFTINALYLNFSGKIYDFFSGQDDLKNGIVKFIGNPQQRIIEDYLRILRFFRFTVLYGKTISKLAIRSIKNLQHNLRKVSFERVNKELFKILLCPRKAWLLVILQKMNQCYIFQTLFDIKKFNLSNLRRIFVSEKYLTHNFLYPEINYLLILIFDEKEEKIQQIFNILRISKKQNTYLRGMMLFKRNMPEEVSLENIVKVAINLKLEDRGLIADILLFTFVRRWKSFDIRLLLRRLENFEFPCVKFDEYDKKKFQGRCIGEEIKRRKIQSISQII